MAAMGAGRQGVKLLLVLVTLCGLHRAEAADGVQWAHGLGPAAGVGAGACDGPRCGLVGLNVSQAVALVGGFLFEAREEGVGLGIVPSHTPAPVTQQPVVPLVPLVPLVPEYP